MRAQQHHRAACSAGFAELRVAWFADSMPLGLPASQPCRARTARNIVTRFYDNYIQLSHFKQGVFFLFFIVSLCFCGVPVCLFQLIYCSSVRTHAVSFSIPCYGSANFLS